MLQLPSGAQQTPGGIEDGQGFGAQAVNWGYQVFSGSTHSHSAFSSQVLANLGTIVALQGSTLRTYQTRLAGSTDVQLIFVSARDGVATSKVQKDIQNLMDIESSGITGVITGKAVYTGAIKLAEAIALTKGKY